MWSLQRRVSPPGNCPTSTSSTPCRSNSNTSSVAWMKAPGKSCGLNCKLRKRLKTRFFPLRFCAFKATNSNSYLSWRAFYIPGLYPIISQVGGRRPTVCIEYRFLDGLDTLLGTKSNLTFQSHISQIFMLYIQMCWSKPGERLQMAPMKGLSGTHNSESPFQAPSSTNTMTFFRRFAKIWFDWTSTPLKIHQRLKFVCLRWHVFQHSNILTCYVCWSELILESFWRRRSSYFFLEWVVFSRAPRTT